MKPIWTKKYGTKQPDNTKKSKLGFPSLLGAASEDSDGDDKSEPKLEPLVLPSGIKVEPVGHAKCAGCGEEGILIKATLPNPARN